MEENVCRICLQTSTGEEEMCSIYSNDENGKLISNKIKSCCGVKLPKESDGFPTKICSKCKVFLGIAYKLRTICQNSDAYLRRFKVKDIEVEDNEDVELKKEENEVTEMFKIYEDIINSEPSFPEIKEEFGMEINFNSNNEDSQPEAFDLLQEEADLNDPDYVEEKKPEESSEESDNTEVKETKKRTPKKPRKRAPRKPKEKKEKKEKKPPKKRETRYGVCPYCGDKYNLANMALHIRRHTGEKPYKCEVCDKAFVESTDLKRHAKIHTGEKPHVCTICGRGFVQRNKLTRHHLLHTGERPFKCHLCDRAYAQKNELDLHIRRHTGLRPYSCGICGKSYFTGTILRRHQKAASHYEEDNKDRYVKIRVSNLARPFRRTIGMSFEHTSTDVKSGGTSNDVMISGETSLSSDVKSGETSSDVKN